MIHLQPSEFFKNIKSSHKDIDDDFEQPSIIVPTLRSYQRKAVKWMVDREKNNNCELIIFVLYLNTILYDMVIIIYIFYFILVVKSDGTPFKGGILADEMGLGKTVEMLSCIVANTAPSEVLKFHICFMTSLRKNYFSVLSK